jgi:hypothetical protein
MSTSELLPQVLLVLGRGDGGADADWEWEIAREMNHSWGPRCCLRDENLADDDGGGDEGVPVAWIELAEGAGVAIDGYDNEGSGVVAPDVRVRWRAALL